MAAPSCSASCLSSLVGGVRRGADPVPAGGHRGQGGRAVDSCVGHATMRRERELPACWGGGVSPAEAWGPGHTCAPRRVPLGPLQGGQHPAVPGPASASASCLLQSLCPSRRLDAGPGRSLVRHRSWTPAGEPGRACGRRTRQTPHPLSTWCELRRPQSLTPAAASPSLPLPLPPGEVSPVLLSGVGGRDPGASVRQAAPCSSPSCPGPSLPPQGPPPFPDSSRSACSDEARHLRRHLQG